MALWPRLVSAGGAFVLAAACSTDEGNPFAPPNQTAPIPPEATLLFASNAPAASTEREVFAVDAAGSLVERLTFCNEQQPPCDTSQAAVSPDRERLAMVRALSDTNGDGRVAPPDDTTLVAVDLRAGLEAALLPSERRVQSVDWSSTGSDLLIYSAFPDATSTAEDLFLIQADGRDDAALLITAGVRERNPRFNATADAAVFERIEPDTKSVIWFFGRALGPITDGGPGSELLEGTPYIVGSDANPAFSPAGTAIVFKRLTSIQPAGRGSWDILTMNTDGTNERVVAGGPGFRGAPDWSTDGIVFTEVDADGTRLVVVQPDSSGRHIVVDLPVGRSLTSPRWLP